MEEYLPGKTFLKTETSYYRGLDQCSDLISKTLVTDRENKVSKIFVQYF